MGDEKKRARPFRKLSVDSFRSAGLTERNLTNFYTNADNDDCIINADIHFTQDLSTEEPDTGLHSNRAHKKVSIESVNKAAGTRLPQALRRVAGHARSQSDGCQNIHLDSALAKCNQNLSLNCENLSTSLNLSVDKFDNISHSNDQVSSDQFLSSASWIDNSSLFSERKNLYEEKEESGPLLHETRFPKPRPGESLISFLSSADLYQNYGALERENAHFYISEALMAAFEQMHFESECRAAGLLSDSDDDSDEEIKCLQKEIRRRKLEKLDRLQTSRQQKTEASVPQTSSVPLQSASTTDYSVYESPMSSTHTESSDPELLTSRAQGARVKSSSWGTGGRPRGKALKRSRARPLGRSSLDGLWSSSGYSGPCDTSAYESNNEAGSCPSSMCAVSTANASDVVLEDTDSTSVASNDGSSDNKTLLGLEDATERENSAVKNENSINGRTEIDSHVSSAVTAEKESSCTKETSDVEAVKCANYGFHGRSGSSLDLPLHLPDHHTAEGIGLRLLQHLGSPQRQLPKASELQWLVSERDAPQELLPLPTGSVGGKEQVLLRGTSDWAPPREQLILSLIKEKKRRRALEDQKYRCAGCGQHVLPGLSKHYRLCHYYMRYFCATCHMNQTHVIPAKLLHLWDDKPYPVSCLAHQLLTRLAPEPLFYPSAINPSLYSPHSALNQFRLHRLQLINCLPYIYSCSRAASEARLARSLCPAHWLSDPEVVSLQELLSIKQGTGLSGTSKAHQFCEGGVRYALQHVTTLCLDHVSHCQACQGRGFICEVCLDDTPIFPFELATVRVCPACSACTHYRCVLTQCTRCKIRKEKRKRSARQGSENITPQSRCDFTEGSVGDAKEAAGDVAGPCESEGEVKRLERVRGDENEDVERIRKVEDFKTKSPPSHKGKLSTSCENGEESKNGTKFLLSFGPEGFSEVEEASKNSLILNLSSSSSFNDSISSNIPAKKENSHSALLERNNSYRDENSVENSVPHRSVSSDSNSDQALVCIEKTATCSAGAVVANAAVECTETKELSTEMKEIRTGSISKLEQHQLSVDSKGDEVVEVFSQATDAGTNEATTSRGITKGVGSLRPFVSLQNSIYGPRRSGNQKPASSVLYVSRASQ